MPFDHINFPKIRFHQIHCGHGRALLKWLEGNQNVMCRYDGWQTSIIHFIGILFALKLASARVYTTTAVEELIKYPTQFGYI